MANPKRKGTDAPKNSTHGAALATQATPIVPAPLDEGLIVSNTAAYPAGA